MKILAAGLLSIAATTAFAKTEIVAMVDISNQEMVVEINGEAKHTWPVSTAKPGKETPLGDFTVKWLSAKHRSSLYDWAPMPWAIFYDGDYAIHGTEDIAALGTPASNGCVRLHPDNAKKLFKMVQRHGYSSLTVVVQD